MVCASSCTFAAPFRLWLMRFVLLYLGFSCTTYSADYFPFCFLRHQADFARGFCYPNLDGLIPLVSMFCCFVVHAFRLLPLVFFLMMFDLRCAYCFRKSLATLPALFSNSWRGSLFYTLLSFDRSLFPLFFDPTLSYLRSVLALSKLS